MTTTPPLALLLMTLGSAACTAEAASPLPAKPTADVAVTEVAPVEMVGTWETSTGCRSTFARQ